MKKVLLVLFSWFLVPNIVCGQNITQPTEQDRTLTQRLISEINEKFHKQGDETFIFYRMPYRGANFGWCINKRDNEYIQYYFQTDSIGNIIIQSDPMPVNSTKKKRLKHKQEKLSNLFKVFRSGNGLSEPKENVYKDIMVSIYSYFAFINEDGDILRAFYTDMMLQENGVPNEIFTFILQEHAKYWSKDPKM